MTEFRPLPTREVPRFAGAPSFLRLPQHDVPADVDVMICGAPFDGGTTFRPGARFGPRAVRQASALTRGFHPVQGLELFDHLKVCDGGDVACVPMSIDRSLAAIEERAEAIARAGAAPAFVGGDHTISLGTLRALAKVHGPLQIVHFDAHSDTFGPAWDVDIHHGTIFRKAVEEGLVQQGAVTQVGLRGPYTRPEDLDFARDAGFTLIDVDAVKRDLAGVEARLAQAAKGAPLYVSFDVDCLDPAFAPGTGTPVPGGLDSYEALSLVRALRGAAWVGMDVVEISPDHDPTGNTALLAASVLSELLACLAVSRADRK